MIDNKISLLNTTTLTFTEGTGAEADVKVNDTISTPYFYKPDGEFNLCWCDKSASGTTQPGLRATYYTQLQKVLQQTKKVTRYLLLTPADIAGLDLLIPVYLEQDSAYYYINKIDSWIKGQAVKVELVKLG